MFNHCHSINSGLLVFKLISLFENKLIYKIKTFYFKIDFKEMLGYVNLNQFVSSNFIPAVINEDDTSGIMDVLPEI